VVRGVVKVEMIFLYITVEGGVERSREGSLQRWCRFNASVSVREGR
jgi:hypothetical protein